MNAESKLERSDKFFENSVNVRFTFSSRWREWIVRYLGFFLDADLEILYTICLVRYIVVTDTIGDAVYWVVKDRW